LIENLETRQLFAVSATIQADLAKIAADRTQIINDRAAAIAQLKLDAAQYAADRLTRLNSVAGLRVQLKNDIATKRAVLIQDTKTFVANFQAAAALVKADSLQVRADRNDPTARAADLQKLATDTDALIAAKLNNAQVKQDLADLKAVIAADRAGIITVIKTQTPTEVSDLQKIAADRSAMISTLAADTALLKADLLKLRADKIAGA